MSESGAAGSSPLEEQRDFLLRSLVDLDRERAAGDVDEHDYAVLKDDYTARAAAVLRAIEAGRTSPATDPPRRFGRRVGIAAGVLAWLWWRAHWWPARPGDGSRGSSAPAMCASR